MRLCRLAGIWLLLVVAGLALAVHEGAHRAGDPSSPSAAHRHLVGSSCPDPGNDGDPCGPECPCACCFSTARTAAVAPSLAVVLDAVAHPIWGPPLPDKLDVSQEDRLHPKEIFRRIFHPPRA